MGDHHDGLADVVHRGADQLEELGRGRRVEVARRLVGEDQLGPGDHRPGRGDPLLLAAGQLRGPVPQAVADAEDPDDRGEPRAVGLAAAEGAAGA